MSTVVDTIREDRDEFLLLAFIGLVTTYAILEALTLTRESRLVPLIILTLIAAVLVLTLAVKFLNARYDIDFLSGSNGRLDFEGESTEDTGIYDINPRGVIKHFTWLVVYTLGLAFIGFWTTNLLFGVGYVMVNETSRTRKRIQWAVVSTAILIGILYVLFVELLQVQAIWRLGFLP